MRKRISTFAAIAIAILIAIGIVWLAYPAPHNRTKPKSDPVTGPTVTVTTSPQAAQPTYAPEPNSSPTPSRPAPDRVDLQDPNVDELAWSKTGWLYSWTQGPRILLPGITVDGDFQVVTAPHRFCRVALSGVFAGQVQFHAAPLSGPCSNGTWLFTTLKKAEYFYLLDPYLNHWVRYRESDTRALQGPDFCAGADNWRNVTLSIPGGGEFYAPSVQNCLKLHNQNAKLPPPAGFPTLKERVEFFLDGQGNRSWSKIAAAPLCSTRFQDKDCWTME